MRLPAPRSALPADNGPLLALAAACPMQADLTLCIRRDPDFFALNRLDGEWWTVGVVDGSEGDIAGCIGVARRTAYVNGELRAIGYVGDLKVHPAWRGRGVGDLLVAYARSVCREFGAATPCLTVALAGNRALERRVGGPRGTPQLAPFATVRSFAVPLVWPRRPAGTGAVSVRCATERDLDEMIALWREAAPACQFASPLDASGFTEFLALAPGLEVASYRVARSTSTGRIAGFLALWDQDLFKATHVLRYSARAAAFRLAVNAVAPLVGAPRLPPAGERAPLRHVTAFHVCVPSWEPAVLRALLEAAYAELRAAGYAFLAIGLDVRAPVVRALDGLWTLPTDIRAYVTTPAGRYDGPPLDGRPLHFETALV